MSIKVNMDSTLGSLKLMADGYKNLYRQYYRHKSKPLHRSALISMKKTLKYEIDDMLNRRLFFDFQAIKKTYSKSHFAPAMSKKFKKKVLKNMTIYNSEEYIKDIKVEKEVTLNSEIYELLTDMNMLAHAFENKLEDNVIKEIITKKNIRTNVFGEAFGNEEMKLRVKKHLDIACKNRMFVPEHLQHYYEAYRSFLTRNFKALSKSLCERDDVQNQLIIPYKLRKKSSRLTKTIPVDLTPIELHEKAIIRLQHIIDRIQHGPSVFFTSFQGPMKYIYYCMPATNKNKVCDPIMTLFYERMRFQGHLWKDRYKNRNLAALPEVSNTFLPETGEKVPTSGEYINLLTIGRSEHLDSKDIFQGLMNHKYNEKNNLDDILSADDYARMYIDAYKTDYKNLVKLKNKYDSLGLNSIDPHIQKKHLMYQLMQKDLISDVSTYRSIGFVILNFMKHVKSMHIMHYHDRIR